MTRYPAGTPYQGPGVNYDEQMGRDQLLARIVYGRPAPLLLPRQRMDMAFFGRLLDALSNQHAALVKVCSSRSTAANFCTLLRKELGSDLYKVGFRQDPLAPAADEWYVVAYNRITKTMVEPAWHDLIAPTSEWVDTVEAARILRVTRDAAGRLAHQFDLPIQRDGGRNRILIRRSDLPLLANRAGRHRRKRAPILKDT